MIGTLRKLQKFISKFPSEARAPTAPQCSTSHQGPSQGLPASLQCQKKLPATRTITGTACLSPVPEEAPSHQGPSQGLPASLQHQKKLPATRDHHRDCLPLSQHQKKLPATGDHHRACLPSVNIHWIFIHSNWKHHD